MLRPLILASTLAAGLVVDTQLTAPAMVGTGTLAPALWLNGEPIDKLSRQQSVVLPGIPTAPRVHLEPQEDVLTSATKLLREIRVDSNTTLGARSQKVPVKCRTHVGRGWPVIMRSGLTLNYTTNLDSCKKSDPVIIKKEALFICSVESCSQEISFTHTETKTTSYGYSISTSAKVGGKIEVLEIGVDRTFTFHSEWSTATTDTEIIKRVFNMKQGERCAATTIQADIDCYGHVTLDKAIWSGSEMEDRELDKSGLKANFIDGSCEVAGMGDFLRALVDNSTVRVDLGTKAKGSPWRVEGCMFE